MAQQSLDAQQLAGQNRNRIHGQASGLPLEPFRLFNLAPHRQGGYTPYGRRVRLAVDAVNVTLGNIARLIGYDETGISSFSTTVATTGGLQLFRDATLLNQASPAYASPSDAVHLDNAGAYITRDAYLVLDRENRLMEPLDSFVTATAKPGLPANAVQVSAAIGSFNDIAYGNGYFAAVTTLGFIYRSDDKGLSWTQVAELTGLNLTSVDYGNGTWIAGSDGGAISRSIDDGENWTTAIVVYAGWDAGAVSYGGDDDWYYAGQGINNNAGIFKSSDKGVNWVLDYDAVEGGVGQNVGTYNLNRVAGDLSVPGSERILATVPNSKSGPTNNNRQFPMVKGGSTGVWDFATDLGVFFDYPFRVSEAFITGSPGYTWTAWCGSYFCAVNSFDGSVAVSGGIQAPFGLTVWQIEATLGGLGSARKVKYNAANGSIAVVGGLGSPIVYLGSRPSSLTRNAIIEDAFSAVGSGSINSVAFDENGDGVYVGSDGIVVTSGQGPGLQEGTYNLYVASYFNTKAGRFIYGLDRQVVSFDALVGNLVEFAAQTKETIISSNAWLAARDAGEAAEIADSLRFDVYIQYVPTSAGTGEDDLTFAEGLAETTIRYAFTSPYPSAITPGDPEGTVPIERTILDLPIGRQIVSQGLPTTVVFEKSRTVALAPISSRTALHSGRIWGLAAQDEDRWSPDGISLEIANQFNRFVLTYTETGWANMVSDQSFIPIQPTQSANFTGILSTPSGLMVMFDNEIFLVTGDPAFGNVTVELYLDMVGCDLGTVPARMGGLPFVIWGGKLWALQAGQAADISKTQWRPEDPFIRVSAEPQTRSLLAVTLSGRVLRYLFDDQFWLTDPINRDSFILGEVLPNCVCDAGDYTRFVEPDGSVWTTRTDGTPDTPHVVYRDVDFGFPEKRTPLYLAKMTLEGPLAAAEYDRSAIGFDGTAVPNLFYEAGQATNGATHLTLNEQTGGILPTAPLVGTQRVATLNWRPPLGATKSYSMSLRFEMLGMGYTDVVKPPIRLVFAAGGETR